MKSFKGFKPNMTCRGYKYEEGKAYKTHNAEICKTGFHACEYPLDCFRYYPPAISVYHEVEQSGKISRKENPNDTKIASTEIKVGKKISFKDIADISENIDPERVHKTEMGVDYEITSAELYGSVAYAVYGKGCIAATTGKYSIAESDTDTYASVSVATGNGSVAITEGDSSVSVVTGCFSIATVNEFCSVAVATGHGAAVSAECEHSIGVAWGHNSKAKGALNSWLVLRDRYNYEQEPKLIKIDGIKYMPDTWYILEEGVIKEVND